MVPATISTWFGLVLLTQLVFPALASMSTQERLACQTFDESPDLARCPPGTIFVSATAASAHFRTIQKAFNSLATRGGDADVTVLIGKGLYLTGAVADHPKPGQLPKSTPTSEALNNPVRIARKRALLESDGYRNWATATLWVNNCPDFKIYNIDIEQLQTTGIALAFAAISSKASLYGCTVAGWQDTFFVGPSAYVYARGCIFRGTVDYLYGWGVLWIESSVLASRALGVIAAWRGDLAKTSGAYISNSRIESSIDARKGGNTPVGQSASAALDPDRAHSIPFMRHVFEPAGFTPWWKNDPRLGKQTFFAEYDSRGSGGTSSGRKLVQRQGNVDVNHLSYILNEESAKQFNVGAVFAPGGGTGFIDFNFKGTAAQAGQVPDILPNSKSTSGSQGDAGQASSHGSSGLHRSTLSHRRRKSHHRS